tara:strand:+ start:106 stop:342 length:237 start_codon:yes stop_codon:yes gene_type:complete
MIKLKEILNEAPKMRNVTIGDKFISRQRKSDGDLEVIDFYVTKNIKGKVVDAKVLAINSLKVTSLHPFSSVVRGRVDD